MKEGTYGQCVDCGKPVPEGRLEARPEASRCVACQPGTTGSAARLPGAPAYGPR